MLKATIQYWYFLKGIFFGFPNAIRRRIFGYGNPRYGSGKNIDRDLLYALEGVERFEVVASQIFEKFSFEGKRILEIGPGPDLYSGIAYLSRGASRFLAIDRFPLTSLPKRKLFSAISPEIKNRFGHFFQKTVSSIENEGIFSYRQIVAEEASSILPETFDIIVSRAACEHFSDPKKVFGELFALLVPGGMMIHEIDFQTHNRFVKKNDPLNIYRYSENLYRNILAFPGSPNRFLMDDYRRWCKEIGYNPIHFFPLLKYPRERIENIRPFLALPYQERSPEDLETLAVILIAQKPF